MPYPAMSKVYNLRDVKLMGSSGQQSSRDKVMLKLSTRLILIVNDRRKGDCGISLHYIDR